MRFILFLSVLVATASCSPINYYEAPSSARDDESSTEKLEQTTIQSVVDSSLENLESTPIQSSVDSSIEKLEQTTIQSAVDSSIEKLEQTTIQSTVDSSIEKIEQTNKSEIDSSIEKLELTTIQSVVDSSVEKLEQTTIQAAAESSIEKLKQTEIRAAAESSVETQEITTPQSVETSVEKQEVTTIQSVDDSSSEIRQQDDELSKNTKKNSERATEQQDDGNDEQDANKILNIVSQIQNEKGDTPQEEAADSVESATERNVASNLDLNEEVQFDEEAVTEKSQTIEEDDVLESVSELKNKYIDDQVSYIDSEDYSNDVSLDSFDFGLENEFDGMKATYGLDKLKKLKFTKKGLPLLAKVIGILVAAGTVDSTMIEALIDGVVQEVQDLTDQAGTSGASGLLPDITSVIKPEDLSFRGDEKTAEAILRGSIDGEIFFIQNYDGEGNPDDIVIAGTLAGMRSDSYSVKIHEFGITESESCSDAGRPIQAGTRWENFSPDSNGEALIFLLDNKLSLDGGASIMDRTVVVRSSTTGNIVGCGSIKHHQL